MKIQDQNFTKDQFIAIYNFLKMVKETNNSISSNSKIDGLQFFKDKDNNFYASYCSSGYGTLGFETNLEYIEINKDGVKSNLLPLYTNISDIARRFEKYEEITL